MVVILSPDVLPDPPEGAPQVEAITGKTVTLSWRKPRRLDPSIGTQNTYYKKSLHTHVVKHLYFIQS